MKGNKMAAKGFTKYTGNIKATGSTKPAPNPPTKAKGGKVRSNVDKISVKKPSRKS